MLSDTENRLAQYKRAPATAHILCRDLAETVRSQSCQRDVHHRQADSRENSRVCAWRVASLKLYRDRDGERADIHQCRQCRSRGRGGPRHVWQGNEDPCTSGCAYAESASDRLNYCGWGPGPLREAKSRRGMIGSLMATFHVFYQGLSEG